MYLINLGIVAKVKKFNFLPKGGIDGILKFLIYFIVVVIISSLLYKFFEIPIMNLRDKEILRSIFHKLNINQS